MLEKIRHAMATCGKTRNRISVETGIDPAALSRLASGERGITIETAERLAPAVGLEIIVRPKRRKKRKGGK